MRLFKDDDAGYLAWVERHQDGFVVNTYRQPHSSYLMLHRATCGTIRGKPARGDRWTTGEFLKVCSETRVDLEQWACENVAGTLTPCGICRPLPGEATVDRHYLQTNATSRQRLRELVARLSADDFSRQVSEEWTIGATLAHLAFWDQSCLARWDEFDRKGSFVSLSDATVDLINTASLPTWLAIPGPTAADLVIRAAEAADGRTEHLSQAALAYVLEHDRAFILDRAGHRHAHLDEIEQLLNS